MKPDSAQHKLITEGHDDGAVINKLVLRRLGLNLAQPPSHRIVEAPPGEGGVDAAIRKFAAAVEARRPKRLGLVIDRDGEAGKPDRWLSVRGVLRGAGLSTDEEPQPLGLRLEVPWGRIGVWLMPDNVSPGTLETFLRRLLPAHPSPLWKHAMASTTDAAAQGAPYRQADSEKATLHTWLAWQDPPGNPYGTALEAGAFDVNEATATAFVDWFSWLLEPERA